MEEDKRKERKRDGLWKKKRENEIVRENENAINFSSKYPFVKFIFLHKVLAEHLPLHL